MLTASSSYQSPLQIDMDLQILIKLFYIQDYLSNEYDVSFGRLLNNFRGVATSGFCSVNCSFSIERSAWPQHSHETLATMLPFAKPLKIIEGRRSSMLAHFRYYRAINSQ